MLEQSPFKLRLLHIAMAGAIAMPTVSFAAENEEDDENRITITGSHIKRNDIEGPSPVTTLTAEDIENSGVTDLISLFAKLPMAGQGTFSTQGNSSDDTANGGSSVSLRGLGADSTLILVNGRRVSVSPFAKTIDTAFVDINNIPIAAIARVEILKDGASATYGSDAIAGVINVILKDDFEGVQISVKAGSTADGGGDESGFSLLWGNSNSKSSHTFIIDYQEKEEILYADRDYSRSANKSAIPDGVDFRSSSGIPGTIALRSDSTVRIPDTFGNDVCPAADIVGTLCRYDYAPFMTMFPKTERISFNYAGKYEIAPDITAFTELNGQNSRSVIKGAGSPSFNELFMDGDNANHPFANDPSSLYYQQDLTMRRRMVDIGNRKKVNDTNYVRAVAGVGGVMDEWDWEVAISYIKSHSVERGVDGFPNSERAQIAIDNETWNPFEPSSNSQAALDFIETQTTRIGKSTNKTIDGHISGPVMEMEHGDLMLGVGAEFREESISDNPDDQFLRGNVFGTEATQANGSRDNASIFVELGIPLLDNLELQLALRREDFSDFGTTTNPKVAFRWAPNEDLVLRGSFGTAFRAPSLHQLGLGRTDESPGLIDTIRCAAVNLDCELREYTAVFEGNPDLGPEESESYNFGVIYQVTDDFSVSVDYYNYDITDIISSDTQFVFSNFGADPSVVERLPSTLAGDPGEVVRIFDAFQNIGDLKTSGLDIDIRYNLETDMGKFGFSYAVNYVLKFEDLRPAADGGQRLFKKEGDFEQPELRWTLATDWAKDDMTANVALNFIDEFNGDADGGFGDKTVDSMTTLDAVFNYHGLENTVLTIGATNLTNEEPPFSHHDFMGFVNTTHSGQGRFLYAKATYSFE
ncbi:MAG: iron complex outermembrane receptor protein [Enterobacterales bacterium]|jgi:iron complex outermembrane receptor protein